MPLSLISESGIPELLNRNAAVEADVAVLLFNSIIIA
jgi:hypothetical protein